MSHVVATSVRLAARLAVVGVALFCLWGTAQAQTAPAAAEEQGSFLPDYPDMADSRNRPAGPGFVDVTLKLAFVLALFGGVVVLYRKYGKPAPTFGGDEILRLWTHRSLGLGSDLYLIEVGDRMLLIGKSGSSMAMLSDFRDPAVIADLKSHCVGPMALPGGTNVWERLLRREGNP